MLPLQPSLVTWWSKRAGSRPMGWCVLGSTRVSGSIDEFFLAAVADIRQTCEAIHSMIDQ